MASAATSAVAAAATAYVNALFLRGTMKTANSNVEKHPNADRQSNQMGSWFCTPCLFGRVGSRNEKFPDSRKESIDTCNADCGLMCLAGCCYLHWLPLMIKRSDVRKKFNIGGNGCTDCLVAACCTVSFNAGVLRS